MNSELRNQKLALIKECKRVMADTSLTLAEKTERATAITIDIEKLGELIACEERMSKFDEVLTRKVDTPVVTSAPASNDEDFDIRSTKEYERECRNFLQRKPFDANVLNRATLVGTSGTGAYVVSTAIDQQIVKLMVEKSVMRPLATVRNVTSNLNIPYAATNTSGYVVGQSSAVTEGTPTLGVFEAKPIKIASWSLISKELAADYPSLVQHLVSDAGIQLLNKSEDLIFNGGGTTEPTSILTTATAYGSTLAGANNPTIDELLLIEAKLDTVYLSNAQWFMNPTTWSYIRQIKKLSSGGNEPIISIDGQTKNLFGYPVRLSSKMPKGTNKKIVLFGDPSFVYIIDRAGVEVQIFDQILNSSKLPTLETGYCAYMRTDSGLVRPDAMVVATSA